MLNRPAESTFLRVVWREKHSVTLLVLLALALRLGWALAQPAAIDPRLPDQQEYLGLATNLLESGSLRVFDERFGQEVYAYRMPGYPLFLAAFGASPRAARIAQACLDASTVLAVYLLARRFLGPLPGTFAAILIAFNPFLIYFSALLLSETLFTCMLAWAAVLLAWSPNLLWGGIVLALSIMVRPSAAFLPILMGLVAAFLHNRPDLKRRWFMRLPISATMLLLTGLVILSWAIRNRTILGQWVLLTTNGGITSYDGFNPEATGASDQSFIQSAELRYLKDLSEVERDQELKDRARQWVRFLWQHRPDELGRLTLTKMARTWSPIPLSADFGRRPAYIWAALLYSIPFDVLVVLGLWFGPLPRSAKGFLLTPALYITAIHAASVGSLRYRIPVEPLLAVLAAGGLVGVWGFMRRPEWRRQRALPSTEHLEAENKLTG